MLAANSSAWWTVTLLAERGCSGGPLNESTAAGWELGVNVVVGGVWPQLTAATAGGCGGNLPFRLDVPIVVS